MAVPHNFSVGNRQPLVESGWGVGLNGYADSAPPAGLA
jgi:hypothetical protein